MHSDRNNLAECVIGDILYYTEVILCFISTRTVESKSVEQKIIFETCSRQYNSIYDTFNRIRESVKSKRRDVMARVSAAANSNKMKVKLCKQSQKSLPSLVDKNAILS